MQKLIRILLGLLGGALGVGLCLIVDLTGVLPVTDRIWHVALLIGSGVGFFLLSFLLAPRLIRRLRKGMQSVSDRLERVPTGEIVLGTVGLVVGFIIAWLVSAPITALTIPYVGNVIGVLLSVLLYIGFGALGIQLTLKNKEEIISGVQRMRTNAREKKSQDRKTGRLARITEELPEIHSKSVPKIVDTSAIIDGRLFEVIEAGFLDGPLVLLDYVLEELQHIADSSDALRRERGRRGLDRVKHLQESQSIEIILDHSSYEKAKEVDAKLLLSCRKHGGKIITTDYNLNKVASVQEIAVLNVNDLANALKPIVIPGETMTISILKEGKTPEQGLAYLDDGTMVVVENGRDYIGKTVDVVVTSVLQTAAGKMIFVRVQ